ncbi:hypothetical protein KC957_04395, partial [Candidatus Saccharibacteria bacterium]|nr:hypothetical protein [Candidatus Saccharibacteria bacterium]
KELHKVGKSRKLPGGAVIVGGTSKLPGLDDFAREKLELPAHIGTLHSLKGLVDVVDDPAFATAIGLMQLDMLLQPGQGGQSQPPGKPSSKAFGLIDGLFKKIKG